MIATAIITSIDTALAAIPHNDHDAVFERGSQVRRNYLNLQTMLRRALTLAKQIERGEPK